LHASTTDSVWAFELGHNAAEIAARLDVPRIRFAPGPIPPPEREQPSQAPLQPTGEQEQQAAVVAAGIEDDAVRQSVQRAVLFSLVRNAADTSLW
jgi:hypothetical protein